ncbi:MAG TPA: DUF2118 domain-containing protein [Acidilobales archaeon]|nr:DUF2118 domain-containing protein [Acidilobales archaeon]
MTTEGIDYRITECFMKPEDVNEERLRGFSLSISELSRVSVGGVEFVKVPCDYVRDYAIDLVNGKVTKDLMVYYPSRNARFLVPKDTDIKLVEVVGKQVFPLISEGVEVKARDKIAYIVTGKSEVRVVRSPADAMVIFIFYYPLHKPEKYVFILTEVGNVERVD